MEFWGYIRPDGSVGCRNHVLILSATIYANATAERVAGTILGAVPLVHPLGRCQVMPDLRFTVRTLIGLGKNPNVGGVVVIDHFKETGCTSEEIAHEIEKTGKKAIPVNIRECGGVIEATAVATRAAAEIARELSTQRREKVPLKHLLFGLNCGTSDTTSGLSSNVALGYCSDLIIESGGRSILAEVTELMGAEPWLASKAKSPAVVQKIYDVINRMEQRALECGEDIRGSQPTGDNIQGGLSTIEEKSLGAAKKSGAKPIIDVINYAEAPAKESGVYIMDTPGHGSESITGIAAAGSQVLVFSTGGGHTIANPVMPTIKCTGNPESYRRMRDTVDLDLSGILAGEMTIEQGGQKILEEVLAVASGKLTKSEVLRDETGFAIHRVGISI
jgi:altronate dehydratase large subunit